KHLSRARLPMDVGRAGEHQLHVIGNHTERHRGIAVEPSLPVLCGGGNDGCAVGGRSAHVARVAGGDGDGEECGACECSVHIAPGRSELLMSRMIFHEPSACRPHTVKYFPLSTMSAPVPVLGCSVHA